MLLPIREKFFVLLDSYFDSNRRLPIQKESEWLSSHSDSFCIYCMNELLIQIAQVVRRTCIGRHDTAVVIIKLWAASVVVVALPVRLV